jgi:hypothetical protein
MLRQLRRLWDEPLRVTRCSTRRVRRDGDGGLDLPAYRGAILYSIAATG